MVPGIDPKVDYVFKILFGSESNVLLLINLLNAILRRKTGDLIDWVEILNPYNDKESLDDKLSILDIKARDQVGRLYNIEMQLVAGPDFQKRILYYWSVLYGGQLAAGEDYSDLCTTISICFVNSVLYPDVVRYHQEFQLLSAENKEFTDHLSIHLVELPKFTKPAEKLAERMDAWCYFLVHGETLDAENLPASLRFSELEKAMEVLKVFTQNDVERERYQARLKAQRDHDSLMRYGPREFERGHTEGIEKGELIGRIELCQKLLKLPRTPSAELLSLSVAELTERAESLERQLGIGANET